MWNAPASPANNELRSFDLLPLGLCILDRQMIVCCWNRSLEQWTGIRREQILGRPYGSAVGATAALALHDRVARRSTETSRTIPPARCWRPFGVRRMPPETVRPA